MDLPEPAYVDTDQLEEFFLNSGVQMQVLAFAERELQALRIRQDLFDAARRLMYRPGPSRARLPQELVTYRTLRDLCRTRRQQQTARITQAAVALSNLRVFRNRDSLVKQVLGFLRRARRCPGTILGMDVFCVAQGCRFTANHFGRFLGHVAEEHLGH